MRDLAQPILHHHFPFRRGFSIAQLYLFVRTLTARPDLARVVSFLSLELASRPTASRNDPDFERVLQAAAPFSLKTATRWHPSWGPYIPPHVRAFEFLAPLAIHLCKNLQAIDLCQPGHGVSSEAYKTIFYHFQRQRMLVNVDRLSLAFGEPETSFDPIILKGLNEYMPSLRTLQLYSAFNGDDRQNIIHPMDLSLLTRLDVIACRLSEITLRTLLYTCTNLTDLTYLPEVRRRTPNRRPLTQTIDECCPNLHRTLRQLTVDDLGYFDFIPGYTSVRSLIALEKIQLWASGLFSWIAKQNHLPGHLKRVPEPLLNILPSNIISVGILEAENWMKESSDLLIELFEHIQTGNASFPNLKEIRVWFTDAPWEKEKRMQGWDQAKVDVLATALGIKVFIEQQARVPPSIDMLRDSTDGAGMGLVYH